MGIVVFLLDYVRLLPDGDFFTRAGHAQRIPISTGPEIPDRIHSFIRYRTARAALFF